MINEELSTSSEENAALTVNFSDGSKVVTTRLGSNRVIFVPNHADNILIYSEEHPDSSQKLE